MSYWTKVAANTQLPPSPEIKAANNTGVVEPTLLSLDNNNNSNKNKGERFSRLKSIANYESFRPQVLACSPPVASTTFYSETTTITTSKGDYSHKLTTTEQQSQQAPQPHHAAAAVSLGAVAGSHGVALFRVTRPQAPILILNSTSSSSSQGQRQRDGGSSHSTAGSPTASTISCLSFGAPSSSSSTTTTTSDLLYLAAARGSGVLIWDVSGHSLSPLWGRLDAGAGAVDSGSTNNNSLITSLAWQPVSSFSSNGGTSSCVIAATTASCACLWDLREHSSSSSSSRCSATLSKPSLRFGVKQQQTTTTTSALTPLSPYIQIACSDQNNNECALLDQAGTLQVFDTRMTERTHNTTTTTSTTAAAGGGALFSVRAFRHAGVGLAHLPTSSSSSNGSTWLSWGLDSPASDAVVRIWTGSSGGDGAQSEVSKKPTTEDWFMDSGSSSPERSSDIDSTDVSSSAAKTNNSTLGCRLVGQCKTDKPLACARVCPAPVKDMFVTVALDVQENEQTGFQASLWKLKKSNDSQDESSLERVLSFRGGAHPDNLLSTLGKSAKLGSLCASELALATNLSIADAQKASSCRNGVVGGATMLLCSLTDRGYITTHEIPEAIPDGLNDSPSKAGLVAGFNNLHMRVFPPEKDAAVNDAARLWGKPRETPSAARAESRPLEEVREAIPLTADVDGGAMPFDMDIPVTYTMAGVSGAPVSGVNELLPGSSVPIVMTTSEENEKAEADARNTAILMESIETDRIPCPRLCGATFGMGIGGLARFSNGEVKKMWNWWEKTDPKRLDDVPGRIGVARPTAGLLEEPPPPRDCPRTLQDLLAMTNAAKEAQWGDQDETNVTPEGFRALFENFFEDSDGSSDSGDDESEEVGDGPKDLYDSYFGSSQPSLPQSLSASRDADDPEKGSDRRPSEEDQVPSSDKGPWSSDMLAPFVSVSHAFDKLTLNNQSIQLAKEWKLDPISSDSLLALEEQPVPLPRHEAPELVEEPIEAKQASAQSSPMRSVLPRYRFLVPSPQRQEITRVQSDPFQSTSAPIQSRTMGISEAEAERGVHGGEYSVRPNMQESMVFLRKLFTHQQEGGGSFPNLFSPPDSPFLPNSLSSKPAQPASVDGASYSEKQSRKDGAQTERGVYTLRSTHPDPDSRRNRELMEVRKACQHNAGVCEMIGDAGKRDAWELLTKVVEGRLESGTKFSGWGGPGGGAMGVEVVENLLRYYESLGDVQMLSTIVCVLGGPSHRQYQNNGEKSLYYLLPQGQDEKFDCYIRKYADLLYAWGLLTTRAELNKHLVRIQVESQGALGPHKDRSEENREPGVALVFTCPRCSQEASEGNFCRSCHDYAFRCVICDNAVRGLFTACNSCAHGGHVGHLKEWFETHKECPTGCGCVCTFSASTKQSMLDFAVQAENSTELVSVGQQ